MRPEIRGRRRRGRWRLVAGLLGLVTTASAAVEPVSIAAPLAREVHAVALAEGEEIALDGSLDEPAWTRAEPAREFHQREPRNGEPATQFTEVRVLFNRRTLYLGAVLFDSGIGGIRDNKRHRDADLESDDSFAVLVDPFADGRAAYVFATNPAGVVKDGILDGSSPNWSWDGIWDVRARRFADGWRLEMAIPFRTLNFDPTRAQWTVNFQRVLRRANEESLWSGFGRAEGLWRPSYAGRLVGLSGLSQGRGLQVQPYGLVRRRQFAGESAETGFDGGLDVTYSITPNLRAALTVNTDFADTEVDEREVNLGRFPLFFPEKRGFFLEGSSVFGFPGRDSLTPFYSRRIGLREEGVIPVGWGTRLAGQAGDFDLGILQLSTRAAHGHDREEFSIARVKRRFGADNYAGALYTRRAGDFSSAAHTVGFDGAIKLSDRGGGRKTVLTPWWVWTSPDAAAPERGLLDASFAGFELTSKTENTETFTAMNQVGPAYDPAIGFAFDRGYRSFYHYAALFHRAPRRGLREILQEFETEYRQNWHGGLRDGYVWLTLAHFVLQSGDVFGLGGSYGAEQIDDPFEIHPGVMVPAKRYQGGNGKIWFESSDRRVISVEGEVRHRDFFGGSNTELEFGLSARPMAGLELAVDSEFNRVRLPGGDFFTRVLRARASYAFTTRHALHFFAQTDNVSDALGMQARFRWTLRPGADVFLGYLRDWQQIDDSIRGRRWEKRGEESVIKAGYTWSF